MVTLDTIDSNMIWEILKILVGIHVYVKFDQEKLKIRVGRDTSTWQTICDSETVVYVQYTHCSVHTLTSQL